MSNEPDKKAVKLTDDEVEKAAGGAGEKISTWTITCYACGCKFTAELGIIPPCPECGNTPGLGGPVNANLL